jgi:general secretion pathway protein K
MPRHLCYIKSEKGVALILVLWIGALLSMAALSLSLLTRTDALATLSAKEELENKFLAEAGIRRGIMELFYRQANRAQQVLPEKPEVYQCDGSPYTADLMDGNYQIRITDESGKINLNTLKDNNSVVLKNLLMNQGATDETSNIVVDSILDWKDKDNLHRLSGAEDDYYLSLPKPYKAKNGEFDTLEELVLVRGVSKSLLYGEAGKKGMLPFCTLFSKTDKINLNAASPELLKAIPGMTEEMIQIIVSYRNLSAAEKTKPLAVLIGSDYTAIAPYVTDLESNVYSIDAMGYKGDEKRHYSIRATVIIEGSQKYRIIYYRSPSITMGS